MMDKMYDTLVGTKLDMCTAGCCVLSCMLAKQQTEVKQQATFQAFIDGPAAYSGEEGEGGQEASQHNRVGGAIIAVPVLPEDDPYDDEDQRPQAVE